MGRANNMAKYNLGQIKRVNLRDVWRHEAHDFTKWLSEEPNLALLGSEIGIELELMRPSLPWARSTST